jgi:hypothetical protein
MFSRPEMLLFLSSSSSIVANISFENVSQFKHLGNQYQNFIDEEFKRRLNSGNACYHSVQMGEWRILHDEELHDLYSSPSIIRIRKLSMRLVGHVARMGERRNTCRLLVRKPDRNKPLRRPRRRWVDNIKMDLGEIAWGGVDWIDLAQDRDK